MSFVRLDVCSGPECSRCGCRDSEILREAVPGSWFSTGQARCRHCRLVFSFRVSVAVAPPTIHQEPPPMPQEAAFDAIDTRPPVMEPPRQPRVSVAPGPLLCEACGGTMKVASTRRTMRYLKCTACGATAKQPR